MEQNFTAILVCSVPLSGSPQLTRVFSELGFELGKKKEIDTALSENKTISKAINQILVEANMSWDSYNLDTKSFYTQTDAQSINEKIEAAIIKGYSLKKNIVVNDPKLCILLPFFEKVLRKLHFRVIPIILAEEPKNAFVNISSVHSMPNDRFELLYLKYLSQAEYNSRSMERAIVTKEALAQKPIEIISQLVDYLKLAIIPSDKKWEKISKQLFIKNRAIEPLEIGDFENSYILYGLLKELYSKGNTNVHLLQQLDEFRGNATNLISDINSELQQKYIDHFLENSFIAQLFYDSGNGINELESLRIPISGLESELIFELHEIPTITYFRFDPINTQGLIQIIKFELTDNEGNVIDLEFNSNANWFQNDLLLFETYDPNIFIKINSNSTSFDRLKITLNYISTDNRISPFKDKIQELNQLIEETKELKSSHEIIQDDGIAHESTIDPKNIEEQPSFGKQGLHVVALLKEQLEERIKQYQIVKDEFKKENVSLLIEREALKAECIQNESSLDLQKKENDQLKADHSELVLQLSKKEEALKVTNNALNESKMHHDLAINVVNEKLSFSQSQIQNSQILIKESNEKQVASEKKLIKLELELDSETSKKETLQSKIDSKTEEIEDLKERITENTIQLKTLEQQIEIYLKRIEEKEMDIKNFKGKIEELSLRIETLTKEVFDKEVHIKNIEGFNAKYASKIAELEAAKLEHTEVINKLASAKITLEDHIGDLNKYVNNVEESLSYKVGFGLTSPVRGINKMLKGNKGGKALRPQLKRIEHDPLKGIKVIFGDENNEPAKNEFDIEKPSQENIVDDNLIIQVDDSKFIDNETIVINGWVLSQNNEEIQDIELWEKEHILGDIEYGLERPDVGNKFPSVKNSGTSGFSFYHKIFSNENFVELRIKKENGDIIKKSIGISKQTAAPVKKSTSNPLLSLIKKNSNKSNEEYTELTEKSWISNPKDLKSIAYYLPQFHSFKENDEWWGKGFTEWTNVTQAIPRFEDHLQPRLPGELGFYDLTQIDVMKRQVELAKQHGLHGFCFHYYWFSGKRVLETPVNNWLANQDIDFPFCINWANENWTRRWDGADHDILLKQNYSEQDATDFFLQVLEVFEDKRYIKIDDRPVLLVYRPTHIPEVKKWTDTWRNIAKSKNLKDPYLIACGSFEYVDPSSIGFDASVEFPPHQIWQRYPGVEFEEMDITHKAVNPEYAEIDLFDQEFDGRIYDFRTLSRASYREPKIEKPWFRCVMPSWDNEARKKGSGHAFHHASPYFFRNWMRNACITAKKNKPSEQFVFINAWNEWAEGAFLEPDRYYGYSYLQALAETQAEFSAENKNKLNFPAFNLVQKGKIAVILHLYYTDLFEYFSKQLDLIPETFDLYISITTENAAFKDIILKKYPNANVFVKENRGRDVGPFMEIMTRINHLNYDAILKIHSKKSQYIEDGDEWRDYLIDHLLGSTSHIKSILSDFRKDTTLGLVAPKKCWLPLKGWYIKDNMPQLYRLGNLLDLQHLIAPLDKDLEEKSIKGKAPIAEKIDLNDPHFPGGTMFWFRKDALEGLFNLSLNQSDFPEEGGQLDATIAHAIERIVGLIPKAFDFKVKAVECKEEKKNKKVKHSKTSKASTK